MVGGAGAGGLSNGGTAPEIVSGAGSSSLQVDQSRAIDFAQETGTSVSASDGTGYIIIEPLPAGTLYTETQSGLPVMWTSYDVTVTVNGTQLPAIHFSSSDTQAVPINNVAVGATVSVSAVIGVTGPDGAALGYSTLSAATTATTTIQSGSNSITMWVQYPLDCQMSSDAAGQGAAITGTAPTYYTNGSPTPLPAATESFVDGSGTTLRFAGWALTDGGTPVISGSVPSTGVYKGRLELYATYSECTVNISTGAAGTDPILVEGETLALTAVPAGFPSAPTCTWSIESPAADAPVTVSASGVVSPVPGKSGGATVKVTATCGTLTATATQNVTVAALSVTGAAAVEAMRLADGSKSVSAIVSGYTGTVEYSWTSSNTAVATVSPANAAAVTVAPLEGGITTLTVTAVLKDGSGTTIKVLPAKTVGVGVLELVLGGSGLPSGATDPIVLTSGSTETAALTATLRGISSGVTYAWASGDTSLFTVSPANTSGTTVTPVAAGSDTVTATLTYKGVSVSASRNVSVVGLTLTGISPYLWDATAASQTIDLSVAMAGVPTGASVTYQISDYDSSDTSVATFTTGGSPNGSTITVNVLKGGVTNITAKATYSGRIFTATKDIAILRLLVTDGAGAAVPESGNSLTVGTTAQLSAVLEGIPAADVTYAWTSSASAKISASPANTSATTLSGLESGNADISVTATYKGTVTCTSPTMAFSAGMLVTDLSAHLATLNPDDYSVENPYQLPPLVGLTASNWTSIKTALQTSPGSSIYVDLSQTTLPEGITNMKYGFEDCLKLVKAPQLPASGVWTMERCFHGCTSLTEAPEIPAGVSNMKSCFASCTNLTEAPEIPAGVTNMNQCFSGCVNLTEVPEIPAGVTNMSWCFQGCTKLTDVSGLTIPDSVTDLSKCFSGCYELTTIPVIPSTCSVTTMAECFRDCLKLTDVSSLNIPSTVVTLEGCFEGCRHLTNASFTVPATVTYMASCFSSCEELLTPPQIPADSQVGSMHACFADCFKLTSAPLIPANVTYMSSCFQNCFALSGAVTINATASGVYDWSGCFDGCDASKITKIRVPDASTKSAVSSSSGMTTALRALIKIPGDEDY